MIPPPARQLMPGQGTLVLPVSRSTLTEGWDMPPDGCSAAGPGLAASAVAQAGRDRMAVMSGLAIFVGRPYLCGPAFTCACVPEDNIAMHAALAQAPPGSVIVCDGGGTRHGALLGELMVTDAANRRLAGIVLDGTIRDLDAIDRIGFPVLAAATAPDRAATLRARSVAKPVVVGGVLVSPGDQMVADRDGAVVVPAAEWPAVRAEVAALSGRDERVRQRITAGERLADVLGLDLSPFLPSAAS